MFNTDRAVAETIIRAKLVKEGKPRLAALHEEFMLALEEGRTVKEILRQKNAIRNITKKDLSKLSIEELAKLTLDTALTL